MRHSQLVLIGVAVVATASYAGMRSSGNRTSIPNTQALADGCRDEFIWQRVDPHYVDVRTSHPPLMRGTVLESLVSHEDFPLDHDSHDVNFMIRPDAGFEALLSDTPGTFGGEQVMECEWETKYWDHRFWPTVGDIVWAYGRHIWDCGHPPYRTEIHPPRAVFTSRYEGFLPEGASYPIKVLKTYAFLGGKGGYYNKAVGGEKYQVDLPIASKPDDEATLCLEVVETPFGGPEPTLEARGDGNPTDILATYDLTEEGSDENKKYGAMFVTGWRPSTPTETFRKLKVTVDSVQVKDDHDPLGDGEWYLWISVNGNHIPVFVNTNVDSGDDYAIDKSVTIILPASVDLVIGSTGYEDDAGDKFGVKPTWGAEESALLLATGFDGDDRVGRIRETFGGADHGVGSHELTSKIYQKDSDTEGDFSVKITVTELQSWSPPKQKGK